MKFYKTVASETWTLGKRAVSYTHLDVYKRQPLFKLKNVSTSRARAHTHTHTVAVSGNIPVLIKQSDGGGRHNDLSDIK